MPEATPLDRTLCLVRVDTSVYGLIPVLKAAHRFTDRAYLHIQRSDENELEVRLRPQRPGIESESLAGEFLNQLIEEKLRDHIGRETQRSRDLILAHALSKTSLLNPSLETGMPVFPHDRNGK